MGALERTSVWCVNQGIKRMNGADRGISVLFSIGCLRAMWIHFYVPIPVKRLLYGGLEYKKVLLEEVVAGRRAMTSLFICTASHRGVKRW